MTVTEVIFYFIAAVTVLSAFGVVATGRIAYAAISLVFTLLAVAALYILLASEFLALVQVLLYAGGVAILLLFVLMLTRARELTSGLDGAQKPFAILAGASLMGVLIAMVFLTTWPRRASEPTLISINAIGDRLFRDFALPFEVASLVLLVALVGSIVLARSEEEEEE
jgi:NADH-quinone oxidoreductase subunit J